MASEPLASPATGSSDAELVDWLELQAFLSPEKVARMDVVVSALIMQTDEFGDEIEAIDDFKDDVISRIEEEFSFRQKDVGDHYPFTLSDDAEEFYFAGNEADPNAAFYLVCLLASHLNKSPFVSFGAPEEDLTALRTKLRNDVFQVVSTIALAGLAAGPAVSIGWPRRSDETILEAIARAQNGHAGIVARAIPNPEIANPKDKDGGMDIIAWRDCNRPPPANFYFGQVASGWNWKEKAAASKAKSFKAKYIDTGPLCNEDYATLVPYRIDDDRSFKEEHADHLAILDRTTLPKHARIGLELAGKGVSVDEVGEVGQIIDWIAEYRAAAIG